MGKVHVCVDYDECCNNQDDCHCGDHNQGGTEQEKVVKDVSKVDEQLRVDYTDDTSKDIALPATDNRTVVDNVTASDNKLTVHFTDDTARDITLPEHGTGMSVKQLTKLNAKANETVAIAMPYTESFALLPHEVLKLQAGEEKVLTGCEFNAADQADFDENAFVDFDGTMKLNTSREIASVQDESFTDGFVTVTTIDKSMFGQIIEMEVVA